MVKASLPGSGAAKQPQTITLAPYFIIGVMCFSEMQCDFYTKCNANVMQWDLCLLVLSLTNI